MGAEVNGDNSVELFSADLSVMGAFDYACANAQAVIHAAAQVDPSVITDPIKDMVEPSTEGVRTWSRCGSLALSRLLCILSSSVRILQAIS